MSLIGITSYFYVRLLSGIPSDRTNVMVRFIPKYISLFFLFFSLCLDAQTILEPGDIAVVGAVTELGPCIGKPESDEISFVVFKPITPMTEIHLTDNGWESAGPGFWGNTEGFIRMRYPGPTLPAGTVITVTGTSDPTGWTYSSPGWSVSSPLPPTSIFNLEGGGDQVYFLQGGTWNNTGGPGVGQATYDGTVISGYNTLLQWAEDGTTHQSNLHPEVGPCFSILTYGNNFFKYTTPLSPALQFEWWTRFQNPGNWTPYADCITYAAGSPDYPAGYILPIADEDFGMECIFCLGCAPFDAPIWLILPPGFQFDVSYTDGIDTFFVANAEDGDYIVATVSDTTTFSFVSVEYHGCPIDPDLFNLETTVEVPSPNAGLDSSFYICPDYGVVNLGTFLGPHDLNGNWSPPLVANTWYHSNWGPGVYHYIIKNQFCPDDTATVTVYHIDTSGTTLDITCHDNNTPNNIFDDRMQITLNFMTDTSFGPNLSVRPLFLGAPYGTATPNQGLIGEPLTFLLSPGTATKEDLFLEVSGGTPFFLCEWNLPLEPPGWCSDPCDHNMTAYISADGADLCPSQCPDAPITFDIEIAGGEQDYRLEFSVSTPGFPTWTFYDIPVDLTNVIVVCVGDVPTAIFDEASGLLTLPKALNGHEVTITFLNVYDFYDCTAIIEDNEFVITIHPIPPISTTSLSFCKSLAAHVDLTEFDPLISMSFDVEWFDENPFTGGTQFSNPSDVNLENVVQLWAYVENDFCGNSIQVPFTILPEPDLNNVAPIQICQNGFVNLPGIPLIDVGNSMATYTFHLGLPPDTSNQIDSPIFLPIDTTTIYVHATAGVCHDTLPVRIDVQRYPDFTLEGQPCDGPSDTYSILFSSSADSIHSNFGIVVNNATGQDTIKGIPNDSVVIVEILNPSGLCKDTFLISAPNCNCPFITQPTPSLPAYSICEGLPVPVMSVTVPPGLQANWYDVPSGGIPLLQNSLTYQPPSATSDIYYVETLDPSNGCYSIRTDIPFDVYPLADLQALPDQQLCETETLDFNTLIPGVLNGVAGAGQWFDLSNNQVVSGIVQPQDGDTWSYVFTTSSGSCVSRDTINADVNPAPSIDFHNILCDDINLTFDLAFTSDADIVVSSFGSIIQIPGTDSFLLENIPFDTDIQFDLQITATGCVDNFTQLAPDCSCPALLDDIGHQACSDQGNVDLSQFEGPGVDGNWQLVSTPAGSNPATLAGSNFQGVGADDGSYTLRFIRNVILADCIDTALFTLQLTESPSADAGSNGTSCAPDQIILSGTASGSNIQFDWQTNGTGSITNPNALNTTYTPTLADITSGSVNFTLTVDDQTGFCPSASETITINIDDTGYFVLVPTATTYCDTSDTTVDLDAFVSFGSTAGNWFFPDTVSAQITNNSQFNPIDLGAGNYTVFYTLPAAAPCEDDTVGYNLIIQNCACPSVALSSPVNALCGDSGTQNLDNFLITTEQGNWTIVSAPPGSKPAVIAGTNFITNLSDAGIYRLRFSLANPVVGCPDFAEIDFEVIATPVIQSDVIECSDDLQSWEVIVISDADVVTANLGTLTSLGNDQYLIENITLNSSLLISASNGNGLCNSSMSISSPDCACEINISNLPDSVSLCQGDIINLEPHVNDAKGAVTSFWIVANDSLYQNSLEIDDDGTYMFVSIDSLGCKDEKTIDVSIYQEMVPDISLVDITCPGDNDGSVSLNAIQGGNGPFFISFNGSSHQPITSFPYVVNGLNAGDYPIEILDAFNCIISFDVEIKSASSESIQLGPDQTILAGDSILISPVLSFVPDSFYWLGDLASIDPAQLDNWIQPDVDQYFELFGIDDKGCIYRDDLVIKVLLSSKIYVPTIFSPNDDGVNDWLVPLPDPSVTSIDFFEIYSRWGEVVFAAPSFEPGNNPGWDGTSHDKPMMPGVYLYRLSATNKKGKVFIQYGDITLMR